MFHGMTKAEVAEFKRIRTAGEAVRDRDDIMAVKRMAARWVRDARTATARQRRMNATRCIRGVYSHF